MWGTLRELLVITALCGIVTAGGVGPVAGAAGGQLQGEPPLADAGLDQTVPLGATVYLDGGGSVDPDGTLVGFEWAVETPSGTTTAHDCLSSDCAQASFDPSQTGVYAVTLTVTDDDGHTASDTLYVTVTEEEPPSVTLTGPDTLQVGEPGTFELHGERGDNFLSAVTWRVDGDRADRFFVDDARTWEFTRAFDQPGTYTVSGTLSDVIGLSATATQTVEVQSNATNRFEVSLSTNSPVLEGDTATVTATIENTGEKAATQEIVYDGPPANADRMVTLAGNESTTETFQWETETGDAGEYPVAVSSRNDTATGTLDVLDNATETPYFDVNITDTNSPVEPGDDVTVTANITNEGSKGGTTTVTANFGPVSFPETEVLTLDPGESTEQQFTFSPSDSVSTGSHPVSVSTDNRTDTEEIKIKEGNVDIRVTELTAGEEPWPDTKDGGMDFAAIVKNVGDDAGSDTVKLRLPGEDITIAKAETGDLAAPDSGEDCSVSEPCATVLDRDDWTFVEVPGTADGKWAPDGDNGWWKYSHKDATYSLMPSTETGNHDAGYQLFMPNLPQFAIDAQPVTESSGGNGKVAYGVEVTVTNTGYYEGTAHVTASQIESLYEERGSAPCDECELIDLPRSLNTEAEFVDLEPGESAGFNSGEFVVPTIHGFQQDEEELEYEVEVGPPTNRDWAQEDIHDEEELEDSWEWNPKAPPGDGGSSPGCGDVWIEQSAYSADEGDLITYVVMGQKCEDGEVEEVVTLSPSQYVSSQSGNSDGMAYEVTDTYVLVPSVNQDDGVQADWSIKVTSGYFNGEVDGAGATWYPYDDGGGGE